jgi:hypothetical protein
LLELLAAFCEYDSQDIRVHDAQTPLAPLILARLAALQKLPVAIYEIAPLAIYPAYWAAQVRGA